MTRPAAAIERFHRRAGRALSVLGLRETLAVLVFRHLAGLMRRLGAPLARRKLRRLAQTADAGSIYVVLAPQDLNYPYTQRTQHLARALAASGKTVFYVSPGQGYDRAVGVVQAEPNLFVTLSASEAVEAGRAGYLLCCSTDAALAAPVIQGAIRQGLCCIYDFVDHFHSSVSSGALSAARMQLHRQLLDDTANVLVVASARLLLEEVLARRGSHCALIPNGVDHAVFSRAQRLEDGLRPDFRRLLARRRPMLGYFGSLASWIDYGLFLAVAAAHPAMDVVIIGPDLDGSAAALAEPPPNLFVLPPLAYRELPRHAVWFDIGLIPFVTGDIGQAASPLKMFEYMALGLPVLSTDIAEARRYTSVTVADSTAAFCAAVPGLLALARDDGFREAAQAEACAADWSERARELAAAAERFKCPVPASTAADRV